MIRISTTGMISRELNKADDAPKNFYVIGSMGHASSIGLGIAKEVKEKIIVLDGDGAALMHLGVLSTIGNIKPKNFLHICLDNESWSSTGGQRTTSNTTEIKDIALACGYTNSRKVNDKENLEKVIKELLELDGPNFLLVNVKKGNLEDIERIELLPEEITKRFMEAIK
jgi:thiamine pyrophosphate-dependent acetolactate synthase large subunit-like protein